MQRKEALHFPMYDPLTFNKAVIMKKKVFSPPLWMDFNIFDLPVVRVSK